MDGMIRGIGCSGNSLISFCRLRFGALEQRCSVWSGQKHCFVEPNGDIACRLF